MPTTTRLLLTLTLTLTLAIAATACGGPASTGTSPQDEAQSMTQTSGGEPVLATPTTPTGCTPSTGTIVLETSESAGAIPMTSFSGCIRPTRDPSTGVIGLNFATGSFQIEMDTNEPSDGFITVGSTRWDIVQPTYAHVVLTFVKGTNSGAPLVVDVSENTPTDGDFQDFRVPDHFALHLETFWP